MSNFSDSTFYIILRVWVITGALGVVASVLLLLRNKYALGPQSNRILIERILNLAVGVLILGLFHFRIVGVEGGLLVGTILTLPLCILYIVRTSSKRRLSVPEGDKENSPG